MPFIVATTSLPVDRPNADRLERRTLVPIHTFTTKKVKQTEIMKYLLNLMKFLAII